MILIASFFVEAVALTVTRDVEEAGRAVVGISCIRLLSERLVYDVIHVRFKQNSITESF